jgi:hypothetical protein
MAETPLYEHRTDRRVPRSPQRPRIAYCGDPMLETVLVVRE